MKKLIPLIIVTGLAILSAVIIFSRCSKKTKVIKIGYAQVGSESSWRLANTESFQNTFTAENGYEYFFDNAEQMQEKQINAIRSFIEKKVNYIVVAPVVESGWDEVLKEAKKAGIPVILSDRQMKLEDQSLYVCWIGANFLQEGRDSVKWLDTYLNVNGRQKEPLNICLIQGTLGATAQIGRTKGILEGIGEHKNWKLLAKKSGEYTQEKGRAVMEEFLQQFDDIDVVFCENDNEAWGAVEAIKAAGKQPGKDIIIICFDAVKKTFEYIINGEINCAVECNPLHGPRVEQIIKKIESGNIPDKIAYVVENVFDITNAEKALPSRKY